MDKAVPTRIYLTLLSISLTASLEQPSGGPPGKISGTFYKDIAILTASPALSYFLYTRVGNPIPCLYTVPGSYLSSTRAHVSTPRTVGNINTAVFIPTHILRDLYPGRDSCVSLVTIY